MKWLKDDAYNALTIAAQNWNSLVQQVLNDNPDMKPEDVTAEVLLAAIENGADARVTELEGQLTTARETISGHEAKIEQLNADNAALRGTPKGPKAEITAEEEPLSVETDIKDFAEKHNGQTAAIMAEAEKTGFFNLKK